MFHRAIKLLAALSLVACAFSTFMWIRSTWKIDSLHWNYGSRESLIVSDRHSIQMQVYSEIGPKSDGAGWLMVSLTGSAMRDMVPDYRDTPLQHGWFGIRHLVSAYDTSTTNNTPVRHMQLRIIIFPWLLVVALTAIAPAMHCLLRWRNRAAPRSNISHRRRFHRAVIAVSLAACALVVFFWIRSFTFDLFEGRFVADRTYSFAGSQRTGAFVFSLEDDPRSYRASADARRGQSLFSESPDEGLLPPRPGITDCWTLSADYNWYPFGTNQDDVHQCMLPGAPQPFPGFSYRSERRYPQLAGSLFGGPTGNDTSVPPTITRTAMIPYWFIFALTLALPVKAGIGWLYDGWRGKRRRNRGLCQNCGFDLRASAGRCPECGVQR
ncbi:MAG TPA: hypothetical protein VFE47_04300 [Tepidisphaeraceae bacterium]|jgi:hypothetical protein|nr:hypothetical protein [Tepidisphaeraceae bacterium]